MLSRANPPSHVTVDISDIAFPVPGDHRIRIMNAFTCLYDYIALDTNAALASVPLTAVELPLASAELRYHGQVQRTELPPGVYIVCVADVRDDAMCAGSIIYSSSMLWAHQYTNPPFHRPLGARWYRCLHAPGLHRHHDAARPLHSRRLHALRGRQ